MDSNSYRCPICQNSTFHSITALWEGLMNGASRRLSCPVCHEILLGLDKLTLHLYSHLPCKVQQQQQQQQPVSPQLQITYKILDDENMNKKDELINHSHHKNHENSFYQISQQGNMETFTEIEKTKDTELQCEKCGGIFNSEKMLENHKKLSHNEGYHMCEICKKQFKTKGTLMVHLRIAHEGPKIAPRFKANLEHSLGLNECNNDKCNEKIFPSLSELSEQLSSNSPQEQHQSCEMMSEGVWGEEIKNKEWDEQDDDDDVEEDEEESANIMFDNKNDDIIINPECILNEIMSAGSTSNNNNNNNTNNTIKNNNNINKLESNKPYECEICLKRFTTKYFHKKHQRLHTGERPYTCSLCNKTFAFQQSFHKHLLYHTSAKPHTCQECGQSFKELSTLHNHQRIHTGERPFICETCGKAFRQRVSYLVHRRIHTGVLPYKCSACDKSFRYKVSQRTHKCTAQPPGNVIRQSELVQRLLMRTATATSSTATTNQSDINNAIEQQQQQQQLQVISNVPSPPLERSTDLPPLSTINEESFQQLLAILPN